jgi:hypothetical protein
MMICPFHNQIGKACALAAATLILPVLAHAQTATDRANPKSREGRLRRDRVVVVPSDEKDQVNENRPEVIGLEHGAGVAGARGAASGHPGHL